MVKIKTLLEIFEELGLLEGEPNILNEI